MRDFPPWVIPRIPRDGSKYVEHMDPNCVHPLIKHELYLENFDIPNATPDPSLADDTVGVWTTMFFEKTLLHYKHLLGDSLAGVQPNYNNELECRYTQTFGCQRDWSPQMLQNSGARPSPPLTRPGNRFACHFMRPGLTRFARLRTMISKQAASCTLANSLQQLTQFCQMHSSS